MKANANPDRISMVRQQDDAAVVEVTGEIDLARSSAFQNELMELVATRPEKIVIDLTGVPHMDSSGIASLVKLLSRCRSQSIDLRLAGLTKRVQGLFEITRLNSVFDIHNSVDEALS